MFGLIVIIARLTESGPHSSQAYLASSLPADEGSMAVHSEFYM
jgi:hypothetical protein